jgi:hypothetical protein
MRVAGLSAIVTIAVLVVVTGCGSSNQMANTGPTPVPQPSPSPQPSPTPNGSTQWSSNVTGATGTVTVSAAGDVMIQVTEAMPSTTFIGNFCQYPGSAFITRGLDPCFGLQQSFTSDANGNGQLTFHFPKSGSWTGSFNFAPGGDTNSSARITTDNVGTQGTVSASLVPLSTANKGGAPGAEPTTQEPGSGSVALSGGNVSITLTAATASASYAVFQAFSNSGSASQQVGTLTTDATGNASGTFAVLSSTGTLFEIDRMAATTAGLASGFTVP